MSAGAQAPAAGALQGTVTDPTAALLPGVEVEIQNEATGERRLLRTSEGGRYIASPLAPGSYRVTFFYPGFERQIFNRIQVSVGQTVTLDVQLKLGPHTVDLIIPGETRLLDPSKTEASSLVEETALLNLPLNGRRWEDLVLLTPAVSEDGGNGLISYRGLSGLYNSNLVDGVDNNQAFFSETRGRSRLPYVYSLATVQEFQVIMQNYSAESGRAAGGIVNAITRSGSNELHGEVFYFFRDDALLARDPLAKALAQPKPKERLQQFGAALGGPLLRHRLFWFGAYDQQLRNFPFTVVPQDPNFAAACTIPQCPPAMDFIRGLLGVRLRQGDQNLFLVRLDWLPHGKHRLSGVLNYVNWRSPNGILRDPVVNDASEALGSDDVRAQFFIFTWQAIPTPKVFNEFRFHFGRDFEFQEQNTSGPLVDLTGFRAIRLGMREFLPRVAFPNEKRFQWTNNTSVVTGRHLLKFGVDVNHTRDTMVQVFRGGGVYRWRTANDFALDFAAACPTNGGRCYRDFVQAVDPLGGDGRASFATTDWGFYVQDSVKLGRHLLLNLGLRYELQQMPEPQRPNPVVPITAVLNTDTNNLAPRVALAWQPGGLESLVIRTGYGLYYGRTPNSTLFSYLFQNGVSQQAFRFVPGDCAAPLFPNVVFSPPSGAALGPPATGLPAPVVQPPPPGCAINPSASVVTTLAPDFVNPLVQQAELSVEYQPVRDWVVSATYLMSHTSRLPIFLDSNVAPATGTATYAIGDAAGNLTQTVTLPFYSQRLNPALGSIQTGLSVVNAWYHGLVVELKKRFRHGFFLNSHLTVAKATDNGVVPAALGTFSGSSVPVDPFDLRREHALSDLDVRRRFVFQGYWELPWTSSDSPAGKIFLQGWKLSAIGQVRDGNPRAALVTGAPACAVNGGLTCGSVDGFGFPAVTYRAPHFGRNLFQGPRSGRATLDLRVGRTFAVGDGKRLEFAADAFNLFNRTHFTAFNTLAFDFVRPGATAATTGLLCPAQPGINGCLFPRPDFLEPERSGTRILGARQWQLSVRFFF
jgi:hypothetical protein